MKRMYEVSSCKRDDHRLWHSRSGERACVVSSDDLIMIQRYVPHDTFDLVFHLTLHSQVLLRSVASSALAEKRSAHCKRAVAPAANAVTF